jgi:OmpA-OmpF porin, OOP family
MILCLIRVCIVSAVFWSGAAAAQDVQRLGSTPSAQDLIKALTPQGAATPSSTPVAADSTAAVPSISLDIKFEPASAVLSSEAKELVHSLGDAVKSEQLRSYRFRLEGHTDSTGSAEQNLALSKRRAEAVKTYMVQTLGVPTSRLEAVGYGAQRPLDPAAPESGVNRRVQVTMLK